MKRPGVLPWYCPECGERVGIPYELKVSYERAAITLDMTPLNLADVMAHAWTHTAGT